MTKKDAQMAEFNETVTRFIDLANKMKDEKKEMALVSRALMVASGTYATYVATGNQGYLKPSGIDKVVEAFRHNLTVIQKMKQNEAEMDTDS